MRIKSEALGRLLVLLASSLIMGVAQASEEPPQNPYLANSAWPMSHRSPYVQGSSPLKGPERALGLQTEYEGTGLLNITLALSAPYSNGTVVAWGSSPSEIYKLKRATKGLTVISTLPTGGRDLSFSLSGAYTVLDRDNFFYSPAQTTLAAYTDSVAGDPNSAIVLARSFDFPIEALHEPYAEDHIVGTNMTYDGYLALATRFGTIAVISRDFKEFHYLKLGDPVVGEKITNSIAVDEDGGIYVVTAEKMHRVQWTGTELTLDPALGAWTNSYDNGIGVPGGKTGGSGSTPSLMGAGDEDKFVVITDGLPVANLVLFWRGDIPEDWQPIGPGKDRRIAAQMPVNYGDTSRKDSFSEQSVLVHGYGAVVVSNNDYRGVGPNSAARDAFGAIVDTLLMSVDADPVFFPFGVQKFEWNPTTRQLEVAWVNIKISCPNGVPTMSAASNLMYCVGQRHLAWNIEALDWDTGESAFYRRLGYWPINNSFYAATQIGPNGDIWSGTATGVMRVGGAR